MLNTPDRVYRDWWKIGPIDIVKFGGFRWAAPLGLENLPLKDWERNIRDWIITNVPRGGVFVDIGAHFGSYSINLSQHFDLVYAVDPHPLNANMLRMNVELNGLSNVKVIEKAAWSANEKLFVLNPVLGGNTAAYIHCSRDKISSIEVEGVKLDDLVPEKVKLVKIDVEGTAHEILKGSSRLLAEGQFWIIELHNQGERDAVERIKSEHGYKMLDGGLTDIGGQMMHVSMGGSCILFRLDS